jgi:transaldolase
MKLRKEEIELLSQLYKDYGQSPWLDNLRREWVKSGELQDWVDNGVRGLTSNPSIFEKAITNSDAYNDQFNDLIRNGYTIEQAYWELVKTDITGAAGVLDSIFSESNGIDGFVSVEVDPRLARDTEKTIVAARDLNNQLNLPNVLIKIPGTKEGIPAIKQMISEGVSVNVTLLFSIERYEEVIEAYISGLEDRKGDLSNISSVASFFISRTDSEVDKRLDAIGSDTALNLKGKAAVAQGQLAYKSFLEKFGSKRWRLLEERGARLQRPLWASTSTKDPSYPDTLYVDSLIGPDTVNTLPDQTLQAFKSHGKLARTVDANFDEAFKIIQSVSDQGINLLEVADLLESEGVAAFERSFDNLLETLSKKADSFS